MTGMNYFRRRSLEGNTSDRVVATYVRGSIRRTDADAFSAVPYFPGVTAGMTLNMLVNGVSFSVAVTGNGLQTILNDINAIISAEGVASDDDGSIRLQSDTIGSAGSVEVTGGTGSTLLGFDTTFGPIKCTGGALEVTPEGRKRNPFGTVFPDTRENFSPRTFQRSLSAIAGNSDVLMAEILNQGALLQKVSSFTVSTDGRFINLPSSVRVFTGGSSVSNPDSPFVNTSNKELLSSLFLVVDNGTNQPAASRVVAVTRNNPAGNPPYANATSWSGVGDSGNVLGTDLIKQTVSVIGIEKGHNVTLGSALSSDVLEGDYVEVTGHTGFTPWNNNGYRWVLDQIIDSTHVVLRPMSKAELDVVGYSPTDSQPITDLNEKLTPPEVYGSVRFRTGPFTSGVNLKVYPELLTPSTNPSLLTDPVVDYTVYAVQPLKPRATRVYNKPIESYGSNLRRATSHSSEPDEVITRPLCSVYSGNYIEVSNFSARHRGEVVWLPEQKIDLTSFFPSADGFLYWDSNTNKVAAVSNAPSTAFNGYADFSESETIKHLLCRFKIAGSVITEISECVKHESAASPVVTVGHGGQFLDLYNAIEHVNALALLNTETVSNSGDFPHYKIQVVSDLSIPIPISIKTPGLIIEGSNPNITISATSTMFSSPDEGALTLKNLRISAANQYLLDRTAGLPFKFIIDNCRVTCRTVMRGTLTSSNLVINNSELIISGGVHWGTGSNTSTVTLLNSTVDCQDDGVVTFQLFSGDASDGNTTNYRAGIIIDNCNFKDLENDSTTVPIFGKIYDPRRFVVSNSEFIFDPSVTSIASIFLDSYHGTFENCQLGELDVSPDRLITDTTSNPDNYVLLDNCRIGVIGSASLTECLKAKKITSSLIDLDGGLVFGNVISAEIFDSNTVVCSAAISVGTPTLIKAEIISNNTVIADASTSGSVVFKLGANSVVTGNKVTLTGNFIVFDTTASVSATIDDNQVSAGTGSIVFSTGSSLANFQMNNNTVTSSGTLFNSLWLIAGGKAIITGNIANVPITSIKTVSASTLTDGTVIISNNTVTGLTLDATSSASEASITGNTFSGAVTVDGSRAFSSNIILGNLSVIDSNIVCCQILGNLDVSSDSSSNTVSLSNLGIGGTFNVNALHAIKVNIAGIFASGAVTITDGSNLCVFNVDGLNAVGAFSNSNCLNGNTETNITNSYLTSTADVRNAKLLNCEFSGTVYIYQNSAASFNSCKFSELTTSLSLGAGGGARNVYLENCHITDGDVLLGDSSGTVHTRTYISNSRFSNTTHTCQFDTITISDCRVDSSIEIFRDIKVSNLEHTAGTFKFLPIGTGYKCFVVNSKIESNVEARANINSDIQWDFRVSNSAVSGTIDLDPTSDSAGTSVISFSSCELSNTGTGIRLGFNGGTFTAKRSDLIFDSCNVTCEVLRLAGGGSVYASHSNFSNPAKKFEITNTVSFTGKTNNITGCKYDVSSFKLVSSVVTGAHKLASKISNTRVKSLGACYLNRVGTISIDSCEFLTPTVYVDVIDALSVSNSSLRLNDDSDWASLSVNDFIGGAYSSVEVLVSISNSGMRNLFCDFVSGLNYFGSIDSCTLVVNNEDYDPIRILGVRQSLTISNNTITSSNSTSDLSKNNENIHIELYSSGADRFKSISITGNSINNIYYGNNGGSPGNLNVISIDEATPNDNAGADGVSMAISLACNNIRVGRLVGTDILSRYYGANLNFSTDGRCVTVVSGNMMVCAARQTSPTLAANLAYVHLLDVIVNGDDFMTVGGVGRSIKPVVFF